MLPTLPSRAALLSLLLLTAAPVRADEVMGSLYVRADTDHTTVVSPHVRVAKRLPAELEVNAAYSADVWTSASVDIRASASVRPVTEQRDQLDLGVHRSWDDLRLGASYRFSSEPDYLSHGASLDARLDLANNASTLQANLHVFGDTVGRSGNPHFARALGTYDASLSYTQVLDPLTLASLTYELAHLRGYQASPYRFVGTGPDATGFGCEDAAQCLVERVPRQRTRHAFALMLRRALGDALSLGVQYRFYIDDWSLWSHTGLIELGWNLTPHTLLAARYRIYYQRAVSFYRERYVQELSAMDYRTRDRELSGMLYQRAGLELEQRILQLSGERRLRGLVAIGGNHYHYRAFVGLASTLALELTAALVMEL